MLRIFNYQARRILAAQPLAPCRHPQCNCSRVSKELAQAGLVRIPHQLVQREDGHRVSRSRKTRREMRPLRLPRATLYLKSMAFRLARNPQRQESLRELRAIRSKKADSGFGLPCKVFRDGRLFSGRFGTFLLARRRRRIL